MDLLDQATDLERQYRDARLSLVPRYRGESAVHCHECGEEIPETRRAAIPGCTLCRDCQETLDEEPI